MILSNEKLIIRKKYVNYQDKQVELIHKIMQLTSQKKERKHSVEKE